MTYPNVQTEGQEVQHRRELAQAINAMLSGRSNAVGTLTLADGTTTTTVSDNRFQSSMAVFLMPLTATAAAAVPFTYLSDRDAGTFELTHDSTADTDRDFLYVRVG